MNIISIFIAPFLFIASLFGFAAPDGVDVVSVPSAIVEEVATTTPEEATTTPDILIETEDIVIYAPVINGEQTTMEDWEPVAPKKADCLFVTMPSGAVVDECTGIVVQQPPQQEIAPAQTPLPQPVQEVTPPTSSTQSVSEPEPTSQPKVEPEVTYSAVVEQEKGPIQCTEVKSGYPHSQCYWGNALIPYPYPFDPRQCDGSAKVKDECKTAMPELYAQTVAECEKGTIPASMCPQK